MNTSMPVNAEFGTYYRKHVKSLHLAGLRPKTVQAYSRAIRRIGNHFDGKIDNLESDQLLDYFNELLLRRSWSTVKLDLYGLKFFYDRILHGPWQDVPLVKAPKTSRIPDVLSPEQIQCLINATTVASYKVFFTTYSLGLRLGEGIALCVGDIDARSMRISMDGKGRWMDNVVIERLWRSLKYECIFLHAFESGSEAGEGRFVEYPNQAQRRSLGAFRFRSRRTMRSPG